MKTPWIELLICLTISLSTFAGCTKDDGPTDQCICTLNFASYVVTIVDGSGAGVDSLQTVSILKRTGKPYSFAPPWSGGSPDSHGRYVVLTDEAAKDLSSLPDTIVFKAMRGSSVIVEQNYLFNTDDCHCHIHKIAGPDTLIVP